MQTGDFPLRNLAIKIFRINDLGVRSGVSLFAARRLGFFARVGERPASHPRLHELMMISFRVYVSGEYK